MEWKVEKRKISSLKNYSKNARKMDKDAASHLQVSLEKFGVCEPIVINTDGTIIGGHMRVKTLKKMEVREVDVYVPQQTLTEKDVEELNIRLNKNTGEFDFDILANEWEYSDLISWGFSDADFDVDGNGGESSSEEDESNNLEPPKNPLTKLGDVYQLGNHRIICGDCTNKDVVSSLLQGEKPILMVTDPPYGVSYDPEWRNNSGLAGNRSTGKVKNDDVVDWSDAWKLFPGDVAYIWHASKFSSKVEQSLEKENFTLVNHIIWIKSNFAISRGDYHFQHEPCLYMVRKGKTHNWQGSRKESTVWDIGKINDFGRLGDEDERTCHSTQKPLECMAKPIRNNSSKGQQVYDPFLGSGTTLIACDKMDRICYGCELDPAYCDVIVGRYVNLKNKNNEEYKIMKNGEKITWTFDQKHTETLA